MFVEQRGRLENEYKEWLLDSNSLKEKPKEKGTANGNGMKVKYDPPVSSFKALEID